ASKGTVFTVPVAAAGLEATVGWCGSHGIPLVVTAPKAARLHTDVDFAGPVAVVVGAEKHGASESLLSAADVQVRIPMAGRVNSLNVASAAAVVLYEAVRQRASKRLRDRGLEGQ
ncbi:MAG: TrmH family RNA methyltransferase, partial [Dermatophilaceae bacterium]